MRMRKDEGLTPEEYIKKLEEEREKSEWWWEIGDKKTNNPTEVISWLITEKAKLEDKNEELKSELEDVQRALEHRDNFFSMMYDVLENENVSSYLIADIITAVVQSECGYKLTKQDDEIVTNFWTGYYKNY